MFKEWRKASVLCFLAFTPFLYFQRSLLRRSHIISLFFMSITFGFFWGNFVNSKKAIILLDKLGKEFQLSRNYKQTIFNKRRDLSEEMKAEIYMKLNRENDEFDKQLKN
jgi:hypothetical protein